MILSGSSNVATDSSNTTASDRAIKSKSRWHFFLGLILSQEGSHVKPKQFMAARLNTFLVWE